MINIHYAHVEQYVISVISQKDAYFEIPLVAIKAWKVELPQPSLMNDANEKAKSLHKNQHETLNHNRQVICHCFS